MSIESVVSSIKASIKAQSSMEVGAIIQHPEGYMVKIISGQFYDSIYGRLSNFWTWRRVNDDGSLGEKESGYGW